MKRYPPARFPRLMRHLGGAPSPTADLYFRNAMRESLRSGEIRQLAPTVLQADRTLVVFRHDSGLVGQPEANRLIYVLDDDIWAAVSDLRLPVPYRTRLRMRELDAAARLAPEADMLVASSDALAAVLRARFPGVPVARVDPAWPEPSAPVTEGGMRLACLMGLTHATDFAFLRPLLETLLSSHGNLHLTVSGNLPVPREWHGCAQVEIVPQLSWAGYRQWMEGRTFDISLYPLLQGPVNAARSENKLAEYDQFGAAVVTNAVWPAGGAAAAEGRCLALEPSADAWRVTIESLLAAPATAAELARTNREALRRLDPGTRQRRFWTASLSGGKADDALAGLAHG